jgi:UDP-N-acetylmuramate dehydrogenase
MIDIQESVDLLRYNTFKIHATARYCAIIRSVDELKELFTTAVYKREKHLILGGGSNILLTGDYDGLVIKNEIKGIDVITETSDAIAVKVGAGEQWHAFVMHAVANNWGGIENLSLIPGTVGAAPMQNIGAYGIEIKNVIKNVEAIDTQTGELRVFTNEECSFGYRESVFKQRLRGKYFISSVTLILTKKNHQFNTSYGAIDATLKQQHVHELSVRAISDAVIAIRTQKLPDPAIVGNAGSFFKNPTISKQHFEKLKTLHPDMPGYSVENQEVKVPAGWLIEQCEWKGKTFDTIGVHPHQALVLVNYGGGTGEKIWSLAQKILASVREKFAIELQPEVNVI